MDKRLTLAIWVALAAGLLASCGGGNPGGPATVNVSPPKMAPVTLLLSSEANAQLSKYTLTLTNVALVNGLGNTVTVLNSAQTAEVLHLNGSVEPVVTTQVPEDTYTSATVTVSQADFSCVALNPSTGGIQAAGLSPTPVTSANVKITLPQPITIDGSGKAIVLSLLASESATYPSCITTAFQGWVPTPSFKLTGLGQAAANTLDGQITAITTSTFNVTSNDGISWSVATSGSTVFEGVPGLSSLVPGMAVDLDAAVRADGTMLATRVEVVDTDTTNLTVWRGPVLLVANAVPAFDLFPIEVHGTLFASFAVDTGTWILDSSNATFQISQSFNNLPSLPFNASFAATNMVAGQNVYISTHAAKFPNSPNYLPTSTITLLPQTLDGTVTNIANAGGFTTYTVTLADYDPFAMFSQQDGQTTVLQTPRNVTVYADGNTQMLSATAPMVGSVLRFNGLVFNDNGTLRMDCSEVLDGVPL